ncbi:putative dna replication complex gins protein sld5 protein [Botrytis fragariae]|uniref:DNA replication complex GINS protein SLD5 n=1 Tax=Botrytis fragariae TaxID=1964551 RepID=A0A8H6AVV2_9HELO|nr:putative dna replication complex gins protein sld5 protein [Botrytis fragariae]KAF5874537.1 putative dna replication complex gins protein sld5 protein [Botrytis fragariae]
MDIDEFLNDPFEDALRPRNVNTPEADLQALTRVWINERGAPEILPWPPNNLVERVTERIKKQIEKVEELTGDMDPKTNFGLICLQTELERWKYLIRGLVRARIAKIDAHTLHYLSNEDLRSRLSETEIAYATRHQQLLHNHYLSSFLGSFPSTLQNLNDQAGGISMISGPDEDTAVFARGTGSYEEFTGDGGSISVLGRGRDGDDVKDVGRGEVVIARWSDIKEHVERGEMELV